MAQLDRIRLTRVNPATGAVERVPARDRVDAILSTPTPRDIVQNMDAQSLYGLVQEAGVDQTWELIQLAKPEQIQSFFDLDCWNRDELALDRVTRWLDVLLQSDDALFDALMRELDTETLAIWLREHCAIFLHEEDQGVIDTIEDPLTMTPDGLYAMVIPEEAEVGHLVRHLFDRLYFHDIDFARYLLEAVRWETTATMTEATYRRRTARLGDMGFVPLDEAIEVFAWLEPRQWATRSRARAMDEEAPVTVLMAGALPPVDHQLQVLEEQSFSEHPSPFSRAVMAMRNAFAAEQLPTIVSAVVSQFRAVANRVHTAELAGPGDFDAGQRAAERAERTISIALQMIAPDDDVLAARTLARVPLKTLHRIGYSATLSLQRQAQMLVQRGSLTVTDAPTSLLSDADDDLVQGLLRPRPAQSGREGTPFGALSDIEAAALRLGRIAFAELLFFGLLRNTHSELTELLYDPKRCSNAVEDVSFRMFFATAVARHILEGAASLSPLTRTDTQRLLSVLQRDGALHAMTQAAEAFAVRRDGIGPEVIGMARSYVRTEVAWLADELEAATAPMDPAIAAQLFLLAPAQPA